MWLAGQLRATLMPSIHIPDDVYAEYVLQEGSSEAAKQAIKEQVRNGVNQ